MSITLCPKCRTALAHPDEQHPCTECDGCDLDPWRKPVHYGTCPLAECGRELVLGKPDDQYATACDLPQHHDEFHEGPDPFGEPEYRVRWYGGGIAGGDPLPHYDFEYVRVDGEGGEL